MKFILNHFNRDKIMDQCCKDAEGKRKKLYWTRDEAQEQADIRGTEENIKLEVYECKKLYGCYHIRKVRI